MKFLTHSEFTSPFVPFDPGMGSILGGHDFLSAIDKLTPLLTEQTKVEWVGDAEQSPWATLNAENLAAVRSAFSYSCPWRGTPYFHFVPICRVLNEIEPDESVHWRMWVLLQNMRDPSGVKPAVEQQIWLGHGYTSATLPCDGMGEHQLAVLALDDGTYVIGWIWVWFNK